VAGIQIKSNIRVIKGADEMAGVIYTGDYNP
jgi:hypothetical protein